MSLPSSTIALKLPPPAVPLCEVAPVAETDMAMTPADTWSTPCAPGADTWPRWSARYATLPAPIWKSDGREDDERDEGGGGGPGPITPGPGLCPGGPGGRDGGCPGADGGRVRAPEGPGGLASGGGGRPGLGPPGAGGARERGPRGGPVAPGGPGGGTPPARPRARPEGGIDRLRSKSWPFKATSFAPPSYLAPEAEEVADDSFGSLLRNGTIKKREVIFK